MGVPEQTVDRDASLDTEDVLTCRVCGCTDDRVCDGGCWWVEDEDVFSDLCSACAPFLDALPQLLGLFRAVEELAREGTTVSGLSRVWEAFEKVDELQRPEPDTRVLDECELHFLRDCGECAEADVLLLERCLP